jgi:hypothetical protein
MHTISIRVILRHSSLSEIISTIDCISISLNSHIVYFVTDFEIFFGYPCVRNECQNKYVTLRSTFWHLLLWFHCLTFCQSQKFRTYFNSRVWRINYKIKYCVFRPKASNPKTFFQLRFEVWKIDVCAQFYHYMYWWKPKKC